MIKFLNVLTVAVVIILALAIIMLALYLGFLMLPYSLIIIPLGFLWSFAADITRDLDLKDTLIITAIFKKDDK